MAGQDALNAVLHCTWTCYLGSLPGCGKAVALEGVITAHESGNAQNAPHDMAMDLYNNGVGANLGGTSLQDCLQKCAAAARAHQLYWHRPMPSDVGLPMHFPAFTVNETGQIAEGTVGTGSGEPPHQGE